MTGEEIIALRRAERKAAQLEAQQKAQAAWDGATANQRVGIRFGMTDVDLIRKAGFDPYKGGEELKLFTVALMDCAQRDGGMRA